MRKSMFWKIGISLLLMAVTSGIVSALSVDEIVANFREKYKNTNNFSADFEETTIVAGKKRVTKGRVNFQKPNLLRQEKFDPSNPDRMTVLIVSDGQTIWSYTPLIKQVTRAELAQDEGSMELLPGFGQSLENVEKNYSLKLVEDELAEKRGIHAVELIPIRQDESPDAAFDFMQVWIRDEDSVPVQFMYKNKKNEMTFILSFTKIKLNENLDESIFKFETPEGVQVITVPD